VTPPPLGQNGFGQPVSFVVQTTGSWDDLNVLVQKVLTKIRSNPNLTNADSDLKLDKPELRLEMNRDKIARSAAA
jgi:multidrug efflux pump